MVFSPRFVHAVAILYLGVTKDAGSLAAKLPWDLWQMHILAHLDFNSFETHLGRVPISSAVDDEASELLLGIDDGDCDLLVPQAEAMAEEIEANSVLAA